MHYHRNSWSVPESISFRTRYPNRFVNVMWTTRLRLVRLIDGVFFRHIDVVFSKHDTHNPNGHAWVGVCIIIEICGRSLLAFTLEHGISIGFKTLWTTRRRLVRLRRCFLLRHIDVVFSNHDTYAYTSDQRSQHIIEFSSFHPSRRCHTSNFTYDVTTCFILPCHDTSQTPSHPSRGWCWR